MDMPKIIALGGCLAVAFCLTVNAADKKADAKKGAKKEDHPNAPAPPGPAVRANPFGWKIHDMDRPAPAVVTPGATPGAPPSDAIVLFGGKDLSAWEQAEVRLEPNSKQPDKPKRVLTGKKIVPKWKIENGYVECAPGTGDIFTKEAFGDCQLHLEFATPAKVEGDSQHRGNSGIFFLSTYELQVLDAYNNPSYSDGITGALYGQFPPYVNICKPPGEWQTYDVVFRGPRFDDKGNITRKAHFTVILNGVVVQADSELIGPTSHGKRDPYNAHADKLPLKLQDHNNTGRYRNIWIRPLPDDATLAK